MADQAVREQIAKERRAYDRARHRLALPAYARASVSEVAEAWNCTGCTARYERGIRVVDVVAGCPAHGSRR